jgi:hypothetical protein
MSHVGGLSNVFRTAETISLRGVLKKYRVGQFCAFVLPYRNVAGGPHPKRILKRSGEIGSKESKAVDLKR